MKKILTYLLTSLLLLFIFESKVYPQSQESIVVQSHQNSHKAHHSNNSFVKNNLPQKDNANFIVEGNEIDFQSNEVVQSIVILSSILGIIGLLHLYFSKNRNLEFRTEALGIFHVKRFIVNRSIRI